MILRRLVICFSVGSLFVISQLVSMPDNHMEDSLTPPKSGSITLL
jgi:hypothetical protein